ncbi:hypothetical protein [Rummeliibacillus stabekisii]|uniref:Uncharacterized protein n=1 Tax=Rummeliibacillus stabekisii TaxID=241244 RepID=A0A143HC04_9BACL|nr:hypothetical protein [Rummeliibacillus stabekisii]AMW99297.1 hypothetical protein ATY39_07355 [Rummeliibacillus stabekisii]
MAETTNAVLEEKINQLTQALIAHKEDTKEDFKERDEKLAIYKREIRQELKELEVGIDSAQRVANDVNTSMKYVKDTVGEMKTMVNGFIEMITTQNTQIDKKLNDQNKKIDDFVNSDKRMDSKRKFLLSVLQVLAGIIGTIITFWASGKF